MISAIYKRFDQPITTNRNAELMPNLLVKADGSCVQRTHLARTHDKDGSYEQVILLL